MSGIAELAAKLSDDVSVGQDLHGLATKALQERVAKFDGCLELDEAAPD